MHNGVLALLVPTETKIIGFADDLVVTAKARQPEDVAAEAAETEK